ncbi:ABC transporter ATP-binding protein [Curtobacterium sp. MCSS17_007]|uniref:ABC transporter ATP-binding protein n=1 Tax=Curtobacterium sp. MCSS17_007 TaxID=2175646 RepID=UPI0015E8C8FB|nr:ABC transporter ATP-binding protein [Curtobacterium sp. MCSS17_007]WIE75616.1 ABC transporter ATP-binding protein [Curtobacterium sp. MCSS17_007]
MAGEVAATARAVRGMHDGGGAADGTVDTVRAAVGGTAVAVRAGEVLAVCGDGSEAALTAAATASRVGDRVFDGLPEPHAAALRRRVVGTASTDHRLVPSLTALANAALPLELDGWDGAAARDAASAALRRVGLEHRADAFPDDLLADEQRGVALARSVVGDRLLVLADDPRDLLHVTLLRRLAEDGVAVLARTTALVRPTWADRLVVVPAVQL